MENNITTQPKKTEESEEMTIKIQTLDNIYPINVKRSSTVGELKDLISETLSVPVPKQRLIFQGKLLQATEKLKTYKITDDNVIHLVAKTLDENAQPSETNTTGVPSENPRVSVEDMFSGIFELPIATRARRPRRRRVPHFDISESFESMHQNITTLQNLQSCKNKFDEQQVNLTKTIVPFELTKSKYEVGQWIDVKDTIDQWLEAQVVQVRNSQVYVHYNGWGNRWDEWIDFSSPRIASFKTYSQQSPTSVFLSPYPSIVPDANLEPQHRNIDTFFYMDKTVGFITDIIKNIEVMNKIRKRNVRNSDFNNKEMKISDFEESKTNERNNINNLNNIHSSTSTNVNSQPNINANNINLINTNEIGPNMIRSQVMNSSNTHSSMNQNNIQMQLTANDYELLFHCSQIVPLMDRTGRLLSDVSLHLSHLLLNSNLYPQLLLGNNPSTNETSDRDNLSCTSGYSIYTNEGSTVSGLISNLPLSTINEIGVNTSSVIGTRDGNNSTRLNNLGMQTIQNSNQMINNYTNLIQDNITQTSRDTRESREGRESHTSNILNNIAQIQHNNVNNVSNNTNNIQSQSNNIVNTIPSLTTGNIINSNVNSDLTRTNSNNVINMNPTLTNNTTTNNTTTNPSTTNTTTTNNTNTNTTTNPIISTSINPTTTNTTTNTTTTETTHQQPRVNETLPKINLQVPAMLSMAEVALVNGYNYNESNIDIYVHTISTPLRNPTHTQETTSNNTQNPSTSTNNHNNHNNHNHQNSTSNNNRHIDMSQTLRSHTSPHRSELSSFPNINSTGLNSSNNVGNSTTTTSNPATSQPNPSATSSIFDNILNLITQTVSNRANTANNTTTTTNNATSVTSGIGNTAGTTQSSSVGTTPNLRQLNRGLQTNTSTNSNSNINVQNTQNNTSTTNLNTNTNNPSINNNNLLLSNYLSSNSNQNANLNNITRQSKDNKETQTDGGSEENNMLSISDNKSDNYKKYYTKSLKSVSDVSDFEQFHDEDHSDTKSKKLDRNDLKSLKNNTLDKLHELDESYQSDNGSKQENDSGDKHDESKSSKKDEIGDKEEAVDNEDKGESSEKKSENSNK